MIPVANVKNIKSELDIDVRHDRKSISTGVTFCATNIAARLASTSINSSLKFI